jgi:VWFA-related protein
MSRLQVVSFALAGVTLAAVAQAPTPSPTSAPSDLPSFGAEVEQVLVDAVVVDKKGSPITGLTRDDFIVREDGTPQELATFQAVDLPENPPPEVVPRRPVISTNDSPAARTQRTFVVVFDDVHLTPFQAKRARPAVVEFLKNGVREGDRVTVVAAGGGAWWSARMLAGRDELLTLVGRLDGRLIPDNSPERMTDYEAMRIHTFSDQQVADRVRRRFESRGLAPRSDSELENPGGDPLVRGRATEVYFQAVSRNRITLEVLERVIRSMEPVRGRKTVILVSQGFIYDPNLDEFRTVVQVARRSNVAIYFLDTRGLGGLPDFASAEFGESIDNRDIGAAFSENFEASAGADSLAADSGGFSVSNTNDLAKGIRRIADESRAYYLLGYTPQNTKRDGRFRKIEVKLKSGKGLTVRARKGYYAALDGVRRADDDKKKKKLPYDPDIQGALDSPFERQDVPLRMTALVHDETLLGKANTVVAADVDLRRMQLQELDGRISGTLEFLLVVAHRESGEYFRYDQQVEMKLLPETYERLKRTWYTLAREFELAPGGYQAKLVVRDKKSGRMGSLTHDFDVPDLTQWRATSLLITDTLRPLAKGEPEGGPPRPQIVVRREFPVGATVYCSYEVYGAQKDPQSGMPKVSAGYEIVSADGARVVTRVEPSEIRPTSLGKLSRLTGTPMEQAPPGAYEFIVRLKDELSGKTIELREPFSLVAASSAAPE